MKLLTFNVNKKNPSGHFFDRFYDVDIYCFQELPSTSSLGKIHDFHSKKAKTAGYLGTTSKHPLLEEYEFKYSHKTSDSLLKLLYLARGHRHSGTALISKFQVQSDIVTVANVHLPLNIGIEQKVETLLPLLVELEKHTEGPRIIAGDFNAYDKLLVNFLFGIARGFRAVDYFMNEVHEITKAAQKYGFFNANFGLRTSKYIPAPLDSFLVSGISRIEEFRIHRNFKFPSDHFPLTLTFV